MVGGGLLLMLAGLCVHARVVLCGSLVNQSFLQVVFKICFP